MYAIIEINQGYVEKDIVLCDSIEAVELYIVSEYNEYGRNYFKAYFYEELGIPYEEYMDYSNAYACEEDETDLIVRIRFVLDDKVHSVDSMQERVFEKKL